MIWCPAIRYLADFQMCSDIRGSVRGGVQRGVRNLNSCNLVLVFVWVKLGFRLPPYRSSTTLRAACDMAYTPAQRTRGCPKISVIIVSKRHHTRFKKRTSKQMAAGLLQTCSSLWTCFKNKKQKGTSSSQGDSWRCMDQSRLLSRSQST
jgi:hypothetical protein